MTAVFAERRSPADDLAFLSVAEAAKLIAARKLSPVELVQAHLDRIAALDGKVHSFITVLAEQAILAARDAERAVMAGEHRGPLHGIPYSLKDNYYTKGIRTTAASRVLWDWNPDTDATLHTRLKNAGAILLGKNNTWEFGTGTGEMQPDLPFPIAKNPWDLSCFAAGSSTGTGVAVASGFAMFGMGSDTGGSVRAPAACNGLFGLKPTYGRLSRAGILPNSFSFDAAGPLTRNVADAAAAMQAVAGPDSLDPTTANVPVPDYMDALGKGVKGLRIGVIRRFHERDVKASEEVVRALDTAIDTLRRLGAEVVEIDVPYHISDYRTLVRLAGQAEALSLHEEDFRLRHHLMGPALRDKCLNSITVSSIDFVKATRWRQAMTEATDTAVRSCDAVICGGSLHTVPDFNDEPGRVAYMLGSATCCFNVSGHPAAAVCTGFDRRGLPMTMQIVGRYFDEAMVMRVAAAYEGATAWRDHHPTFRDAPEPAPVAWTPPPVDPALVPSREEIAAILRRMRVANVDDAMIERAAKLAAGTAAQIGRLPETLPRDLEAAHIFRLPNLSS